MWYNSIIPLRNNNMIEVVKSFPRTRMKTSIIWKMSSEEFRKIVLESTSLGQVLKYFGLENKGGNSKTVKTRCIFENIDLGHIKLGANSNKGRSFNVKKTPLKDILIENSTYSRTHLKERLINEKIIEYKCFECGLGNVWQNKKISLQLEHKNGKT
jgi:hypothetical protein